MFSATTNNKVVGKIGHITTYWNENETRKVKEKVVKKYNDYTR